MRRRNVKPRFWLGLAVAVIALGLPAAGRATTNVVPNPGFEQGGCGSTPIICGWVGYAVMSQGSPHAGTASMSLDCGPTGCDPGGAGWASVSARTDLAFCAAVGSGTHPASFWAQGPYEWVELYATFYQGPNCTELVGSDYVGDWLAEPGWQELTGTLDAPPGTQSALLELDVAMECDDYCYPWVSFDDVDVEDAVVPDTTPPETTITSGPSGTTNAASATFEFAASEPSTFECALGGVAFAACTSPASYGGLGEGSHTFQVRATDAAGNTDPTPAQRTWTIQNTPPVARFTFNCTGQTCNFDGSASADSDGSIQAYSWTFGDGTSGGGGTADHTYAQAAAYVVTLTVTDNEGATGTESKTVTLVSLTARGYMVRGLEKVDLRWSGPSGASFDVYRNGGRIATVEATSYTDNINKRGSGSYAYRVCAPATATCSNEATVSF